MNRIIRVVGRVIPLLAAIGQVACYRTYCSRLEARARMLNVQALLKAWVGEHLVSRAPLQGEVTTGGGRVPNVWWVGADFRNWEALGFDPERGQVRLVGPSARDVLDGVSADKVEAVVFGERSRYGIVIRAPESEVFGLEDRDITQISDGVAVLCREGD